jgi:hypothetical protein
VQSIENFSAIYNKIVAHQILNWRPSPAFHPHNAIAVTADWKWPPYKNARN